MTCSINLILVPDFHASQGKKQLDKLNDKLRDIYSDDRIKKLAVIGDTSEMTPKESFEDLIEIYCFHAKTGYCNNCKWCDTNKP